MMPTPHPIQTCSAGKKKNYPGSMFHSQITSARAKYESKCCLVHWILNRSWGCHLMLLFEAFDLSLNSFLGCCVKVLAAIFGWNLPGGVVSECVVSVVLLLGLCFMC
jgi:hypothetical protein